MFQQASILHILLIGRAFRSRMALLRTQHFKDRPTAALERRQQESQGHDSAPFPFRLIATWLKWSHSNDKCVPLWA